MVNERMNKLSVILAIVGIVDMIAMAATPQTYTITWTASSQNIDNSPIVGAITYQLYVGPAGQEMKWGNPVTAPPYILSPTPAPGETCVQVTATVNKVESARSLEACATVAPPTPKSPSPVIVSVK